MKDYHLNACNKRRYSKYGALYAIAGAKSKQTQGLLEADKVPIRYYRCNVCNTYHLTSETLEEYNKKVKKRKRVYY